MTTKRERELAAAAALALLPLVVSGCGTPRPARDAGPAPSSSAALTGSCQDPLVLPPGETREAQLPPGTPSEQYWAIEVPRPSRVTVSGARRFERGWISLSADVCWIPRCGAAAEECGALDGEEGVLQRAFAGGRALVRVRRTEGETGAYSLTASLGSVDDRRQACAGAPALTPGALVTTAPADDPRPDLFQTPCGLGGATHGHDTVRVLTLDQRSRVRLRQTGDEGTVLALWSDCALDTALACASNSLEDPRSALLLRVLPPGRTFVVSDALPPGGHDYQLLAEVAPLSGSETADDRCASAPKIEETSGTLFVDTFAAHDDVTVECGGAGAPDVFRTLVVRQPSWLSLQPAGSEVDATGGEAVVAIRRSCAADAEDLTCMPIVYEAGLHERLAAGRYVLVFDGSDEDAFGASRLLFDLDPVADADRACRDAPVLPPGARVAGRTSGHDRISGCDEHVRGDDAIFRVVLDHAARVRVRITAAGSVAASFRRACAWDAEAVSICAVDEAGPSARFHDTSIEAQLEAGTSWLVVEGLSPTPTPFELELERT